ADSDADVIEPAPSRLACSTIVHHRGSFMAIRSRSLSQVAPRSCAFELDLVELDATEDPLRGGVRVHAPRGDLIGRALELFARKEPRRRGFEQALPEEIEEAREALSPPPARAGAARLGGGPVPRDRRDELGRSL